MKLSIIAGAYPSPGRPELVFVQQLVCALVDMGVDVSVIAPQSLTHALLRKEKVLPKHSVEKTLNGNLYGLFRPYKLSFGRRLRPLTKLTHHMLSKQIDSILSMVKPDVLYGHFWHCANVFREYALSNNIPLFVACGEGDDALEELIDRMHADEKERLVRAVKGVVSVSTENKRKCVSYGLVADKDVIVLPNCVDDSVVHPSSDRSLRKRLGVSEDDFLILFVGSFVKRKGADRLSKAIDLLDDSHIKVAFVGKPMGGDSVLPACNGIVFQGVVDHEKIPEFLQAADVFVLPTLKEGCSNAIIEALASGLPVISSNRPFNDDILNEGNSIVVDPENVGELARAILTMKNDSDLYSKKREYAISHSGEYSITGRAKLIYDFICSKIAQ